MGKTLGLFGLEFRGGAAVNASDYGHYMIANITKGVTEMEITMQGKK